MASERFQNNNGYCIQNAIAYKEEGLENPMKEIAHDEGSYFMAI
jgi:hypothetical protein